MKVLKGLGLRGGDWKISGRQWITSRFSLGKTVVCNFNNVHTAKRQAKPVFLSVGGGVYWAYAQSVVGKSQLLIMTI